MEHLIKGLDQKGSFVYLKADTGVGKTLALICGTLAWLKA